MECFAPRRTILASFLALTAGALLSVPAEAKGKAASPASSLFDLRNAPVRESDSHDRHSAEQLTGRLSEEDQRNDRVKLRFVYQPVDTGPRLELGTVGAGKGAMKRTIVNVAFGWEF